MNISPNPEQKTVAMLSTAANVSAPKVVHVEQMSAEAPSDADKNTFDLLSLYKGQRRECWMCDKIAKAIESGKEISEDDKWHFSTCVLSWAALPSSPQNL